MCYNTEGVLFAEKDFNLAEHPEIEGVPNLQVIKLMQSFTSKEYVTERFAWRHYYWCVQWSLMSLAITNYARGEEEAKLAPGLSCSCPPDLWRAPS